MKSIDRAIHSVEEKISQAGSETVTELQANLKCVFTSDSFTSCFKI